MKITSFRGYRVDRLERIQRHYLTAMIIASVGVLDSSATDYYVSESGAHLSPFSSLETGATNIQAAVDLAGNGDTVLIGDGEYILSVAIDVTNSILVESLNGSSQTVINGNGICRVFNLDNVDCVISGLAITKGYTEGDGGGIECAGSSPVITNCIISGCFAEWGGGIDSGTIYNSVIRGNTSSDAGGLVDATAYNCLIEGNQADYSGGALWSTLYNCTVIENTAVTTAGGTEACDLYNSIIYDNTAGISGQNIFDPGAIVNCCSLDVTSGFGNITNSPSFVDLAGGNYRLQTASLCKNSGNNIYVSTKTDLDGNTRIIDGTVDMGVFEVQTTSADQDGDGMSDSWEIQYLGSTNAMPRAHGDSDLFSNLAEYIAGTDPTNSASFFAVTNGLAGGSFVVKWVSVESREYQAFWADSLTNHFLPLEPVVVFPQNSYTDSVHSSENAGFYKVEVRIK